MVIVTRYWQLLVLLSQVHTLRGNLCNAEMSVPAFADLFSILKLHWFQLWWETGGKLWAK